jgi:tRNA threonylcarbamoyladenosine biosynthesis protein TsaE
MNHYNLAELQDLAKRLSISAKSGDVFLLHGDLGAGKTTFAQAFIQARYPGTVVTSPTFSICQDYGDIVHYDLYRISEPIELNELDIQEHFHHKICLVEWPEILGFLTPKTVIHIHIEPGATSDTRMILLSSSTR